MGPLGLDPQTHETSRSGGTLPIDALGRTGKQKGFGTWALGTLTELARD